MRREIVAVALVLLVGLAGCLPYQASAPVGDRGDTTCEWVRARVYDGSLPLAQAQSWYPHCAPFEVGPR